jgi:hypothetical protein
MRRHSIWAGAARGPARMIIRPGIQHTSLMNTGPSLSCAASAAAARRPQPAPGPAATGNHELDHDSGPGQGARPVTTTQASPMMVTVRWSAVWAATVRRTKSPPPKGGLLTAPRTSSGNRARAAGRSAGLGANLRVQSGLWKQRAVDMYSCTG